MAQGIPVLESSLRIGDFISHSGAKLDAFPSFPAAADGASLCLRWSAALFSTIKSADAVPKLVSVLSEQMPEAVSLLGFWPNQVFVFGHPTGKPRAWR